LEADVDKFLQLQRACAAHHNGVDSSSSVSLCNFLSMGQNANNPSVTHKVQHQPRPPSRATQIHGPVINILVFFLFLLEIIN